MLDRLTGKPIHLYVLVFSCTMIAVGLPLNKVLLSLGIMLGMLNLLLEADFRSYRKNLAANKIAWCLWAYILIEWLSLAWTHNWDYALHDLKAKLPLYLIPLFLIARPISDQRILHGLLGAFLLSLFVTSFINAGSYLHWWGARTYDDIRGMSLFGSHIRYALMIVMGIVIAVTWFMRSLPYRWIAVLLAIWFTWYTYFSQILSGYLALGVILLIAILMGIRSLHSKTLRLSLMGTLLAGMAILIVFIVRFLQPVPHKMSIHLLPKETVNGNWYWSDTVNVLWENGYPIAALVCQEELAPAWNRVSAIDYYTGLDHKKQPVSITLWRYMTSRGLRKDSLDFLQMTATDIRNVENGIASIRLTGTGIKARLYGIQHQLEHRENPNGHSLLQRLEYWKAARSIIRNNWLTGVGAGDVQDAFDRYYVSTDSMLYPDLRRRAHNQYLTTWITSGIAGLFAFLLWWLVYLRFSWNRRHFLALGFIGISMCSFLIEDTIETQAGVTFVAFFFGLLVSSCAETYGKNEMEERDPIAIG